MSTGHFPDFVIQGTRNHAVYFVEVKFRASGSFKYADHGKDYPYSNAYIIVVSKKHIKCLTVEDLKNVKEVTLTCRNYLGSRKEFDLDKDVIVEFCDSLYNSSRALSRRLRNDQATIQIPEG